MSMNKPALVDQVHFRLPPAKWKAFCEALDRPPRDIPALRRLFAKKSVFERSGKPAAG